MRNIEKFFDKDNLDLTLLDKIEILIRDTNEIKYEGYEKDIEYLNYLNVNYGRIIIDENLRQTVEQIIDEISEKNSISPVRKGF